MKREIMTRILLTKNGEISSFVLVETLYPVN